jgi:hypothetical protein
MYSVTVKDSNNVTTTQTITLSPPPPNQTYQLTLALSGPNAFNVTVSPALPVGASITYTIKHESVFTTAPSTTVAVYNNVVTISINGVPITTPTPILTPTTSFNPCNSGSYFINTNITTWSNLTFNSTTTVTGTYTNVVNPITPLAECYSAVGQSMVYISSATLNNCNCCNLTIINPKR